MKPQTQRILIGLCLWAATSAFADDVIRTWVDDKGRVHYSNVAPDQTHSRDVQAPPAPTSQEYEASHQRAVQEKGHLAKWGAARPVVLPSEPGAMVSCERAMQIIGFLQGYQEVPVLRPMDSGEVTWLSDPERTHYLALAKQQVEDTCTRAREVTMHDLWVGLFWPRTARAATITPTQFITPPVTPEPDASIRGGRPATAPTNPTTALINAKRANTPVTSVTSIVGAKRPTAAANPNAGTLK